VVVLLGRGPAITAAATSSAAVQLRRNPSLSAYVSGDARSTTERLVQLGVAPSRIAGDSCARTTWENATFTASWLRQHHPGAPVLVVLGDALQRVFFLEPFDTPYVVWPSPF
jgi:uncharacterized SAM-binding protein YcdF (DUF218 family)